jgi:uncharacterized phiE125 gp8 family phage protein
MALKLIEAPAVTLVTLADAKLQCRVDGSEEDTLLQAYIAAATAAAEHELGRALITQTWEAAYDAFPACGVRLGKPRVLSIVSVSYISAAGAAALIEPEDVVLDADNTPGWALPAAGKTWPATYATANAVRIRFTCGYGPAPADVPANVRQWILMHIATAYRNREAMAQGVSISELPNRYVDRLLDSERQYNL